MASGTNPAPIIPSGKVNTVPRQSTATQIKLKVIQGSIERLMTEIEELGEIKEFLTNLRKQMDEEAEIIHNITDVAHAALVVQQNYVNALPDGSETFKALECDPTQTDD